MSGCLSPRFCNATIALIKRRPLRRLPLQWRLVTIRASSTGGGRSYKEAVHLLESLESNRTIVQAISKDVHSKSQVGKVQDMNSNAIPEMIEWASKAGYTVSDFANHGLRCVHVAGTKGKGSVCMMVENMLLQYRNGKGSNSEAGLGKVGLYTSPHLLHVRERIRIDGAPISEAMFAQYFFELWDRFSGSRNTQSSSSEFKPGYFRYLTLLAFHTFIKEGVHNAVIECGIGGEYDSTNILPAEAITTSGITRLGIDHIGMLGETLVDIAWHKAGIMRNGVPAFTVEQSPEALGVLQERATKKEVELTVIPILPIFAKGQVKLGLEGDFQRDNASLAVALATSHLQTCGLSEDILHAEALSLLPATLPEKIKIGLENVRFPGRCQVVKDGNIEWLIDGAHTQDSIEATAAWFHAKLTNLMNTSDTPGAVMLIFNQQDRDAKTLLHAFFKKMFQLRNENAGSPASNLNIPSPSQFSSVAHSIRQQIFTYAAFCPNVPFKSTDPKRHSEILEHDQRKRDERSQRNQAAQLYQLLDGNRLHMVYDSVEEAVDLARRVTGENERLLVLTTGSLHLAGALLQVLEAEKAQPHGQQICRTCGETYSKSSQHICEGVSKKESLCQQIDAHRLQHPPTHKKTSDKAPEKRLPKLEARYTCPHDDCREIFTKISDRKRHEQLSHGDSESKNLETEKSKEGFKCSYKGCSKVFAHRASRYRHEKYSHSIPRPEKSKRAFACSVPGCDSSFNRRTNLQEHERNVHGRPPSLRKTHLKTEKPFLCPFLGCQSAFLRDYALRHHEKVSHSPSDPRKIIPRETEEERLEKEKAMERVNARRRELYLLQKQKTDLVEKEETAKKKIFKCSHGGCDARFIKKSNLDKHERLFHEARINPVTKEEVDKRKSFRCSHEGCVASFTRRYNLRKHQKLVHGT